MSAADRVVGGPAETPAPPAPLLDAFFGDRSPLAVAFAEHLATTAVSRGLLGPREVPRLWDRHIFNCVAIAALVPPSAVVADVGSGAGLPGVVLAIARPDITVTLVEPLLRRVSWLEEVLADLRLGNVSILRARAEELGRDWADVATARAVAPLVKLTAWCLPLVRPTGLMLAIKGRSAGEELREAAPALPPLGAASWRVLETGGDLLQEPTTVVEIRKGSRGRRASGPRPAVPAGRRA